MGKTETDGTTPAAGSSVASLAEQIRAAADLAGGPGAGGQGGFTDAAGEHQAAPEKQTYSPEDVKELLTLPADFMYAITGKERWILGEREKEILAQKGARALELLIAIDPKKFIIGSFLLTLGTVYGTRGIAEAKEHFRKKQQSGEEKVSMV